VDHALTVASYASNSAGPSVLNRSEFSGGFLGDIDLRNVPPELKQEGDDWFVVFNPGVKRVLDVSLVHAIMHERCAKGSPRLAST
jgi:hypothetical protein